jgi:hypothetical protein
MLSKPAITAPIIGATKIHHLIVKGHSIVFRLIQETNEYSPAFAMRNLPNAFYVYKELPLIPPVGIGGRGLQSCCIHLLAEF